MSQLRKILFASLTLVMLSLGCLTTAWADPVTVYTNRAAFNNASTGNQTIDFTGSAPNNGSSYYPDGLTILGVRFQATATERTNAGIGNTFPDLQAYGSGSPDVGFHTNWNSGVVLVGGLNEDHPGQRFGGSLTITLPANGATAFGLDLGYYGVSAGTVRITLSTGEVFFINPATYPIFNFFGFTSNVPVVWIDIRTTDERFGNASRSLIDNVTFGQAAPVPEPATLFLLGTGLAGLAARRRRRSRADK